MAIQSQDIPRFPFHKERMTQAFVNLGVTQAMTSNVGSLVQDLVEMAEAVKLVPVLQGELLAKTHALDEAQQHNQGLESNIVGYKAQIEDLQDKVRSLEVERDDASFRVLEAEDKTYRVLGLLRDAKAIVELGIADLDPPKPITESEVVENTEAGKTSSDTSPPDWKQDQAETSRMPPGQSVVDPTASIGQQETAANSAPATTADVGMITTETVSVELTKPDAEGTKPSLGLYFNKRYYEQPNYIPLHEWLAGGGTEDNYHWRPSANHGLSY